MYKNNLPKLKKVTLVEDFIQRFEEMILTGQISAGEKLPSERDLAARLNVSRPVVHEGLINLANKGLINRSVKGNTTVNDYRIHGSISLLNTILNFHSGVLEPKLAKDIIDLRSLIELENVRLATQNRTEEQLLLLKKIIEEETQIDIKDIHAVAQLDFKLHHTVAIASNNTFYPLLINSFKPLYLNGAEVFFSDLSHTPIVFDFHSKLVNLIKRQETEEAIKVMNEMLEHGMNQYFAMVDNIDQ